MLPLSPRFLATQALKARKFKGSSKKENRQKPLAKPSRDPTLLIQ
jgi:hypothetical protein